MTKTSQEEVSIRKKVDNECIQEVLLYYKNNGRHDLPWRKKITGYSVLVSEVMLQQTQVARVAVKFETWMKYYPTLAHLRKATLRDVLLLWQGLGYQRRAKALYEIGKRCNVIPESFDELLMLPGIGTYTASAVSAFAYDHFAHPVLETNIRTVLIECFHQGEEVVHDGVLYDDLARLEKYKKVRDVGARVWYYALMDFGAHLKSKNISHNKKSAHYAKQSPFKGSLRELRAKTLFAITNKEPLPVDERLQEVLSQLIKEDYISKQGNKYFLKD